MSVGSKRETVVSPLEQRRVNLVAALGFAQVAANEPVLNALRSYLNSWRGVGDVVVGMARQGYDLQLTEFNGGQNWRATFYVIGTAHSIVQGVGVGNDGGSGGAEGGMGGPEGGRVAPVVASN